MSTFRFLYDGTGEPLIRRAAVAWLRDAGHAFPASDSYVCEIDGKRYVALKDADTNAVVAVFRVLPSDRLKRLRRWPRKLTDGGE